MDDVENTRVRDEEEELQQWPVGYTPRPGGDVAVWDAVTGEQLPPELVQKATRAEINSFRIGM